jgi:hypothetical protein
MATTFDLLGALDQDRVLDRVDPMTTRELRRAFAESLGDAFEDVDVAGVSYCPALIIRKVDPSRYESMFSEWLADCPVLVTIDDLTYDVSELDEAAEEMIAADIEAAIAVADHAADGDAPVKVRTACSCSACASTPVVAPVKCEDCDTALTEDDGGGLRCAACCDEANERRMSNGGNGWNNV